MQCTAKGTLLNVVNKEYDGKKYFSVLFKVNTHVFQINTSKQELTPLLSENNYLKDFIFTFEIYPDFKQLKPVITLTEMKSTKAV